MNKNLKKAIAIVALVFMALFVVALVLTCIDIKMLNGAVGYVALFTGFIGISLYVVLLLDAKAAKRNEEAAKRHDLTGASDKKGSEPPTEKAENDTPQTEEAPLENDTPDNT